MKKTENLVAILLAIYGILCAVSIALYALIQLFVDDKSTATNLLIWSATIFAPIIVLHTFSSWSKQRGMDEYAKIARNVRKIMRKYDYEIYIKILFIQEFDLFSPDENFYKFQECCQDLTKIFDEYLNDLWLIEGANIAKNQEDLSMYYDWISSFYACIHDVDINSDSINDDIETIQDVITDNSKFMLLHIDVLSILEEIGFYEIKI